jgi:hypothetical protein
MKNFFAIIVFSVVVVSPLVSWKVNSNFPDSKGETDEYVKPDPDCLENQNLINWLNASDSLAAYLNHAKSQLSSSEYELFKVSMRNDDPQQAFSHCGSNGPILENMYISTHNNFVSAWNNLKRSIDPNNQLSVQQLGDVILKLIDCYYSDENNQGSRVDPCKDQFERCKRAAKRDHNRDLWACYAAGLGFSFINPGFGLGFGIGCIVGAGLDYNEAVADCQEIYDGCKG